MPLVSVIMPCFNHGSYVVESIRSVLGQTEGDLELIVVDDGSSDDSPEVIESAAAADGRIRPLYHPTNKGASRSRNDGLNHASGEYVAFCDADDLWLPEKLEKQLDLLESSPAASIAYSDARIIDDSGREIGELFSHRFPVPGSGSGDLLNVLAVRNFINMQSALVRRECITEEDYFDPNIKYVEDWLFWIRLARSNSFLYNPEPLCLYRVHEGSSATSQTEAVNQNRVKVYLQALHYADRLPWWVLSEIFYRLGVGITRLNDNKEKKRFYRYAAKRYYTQALMHNPFHWKSAVRLLLSYARA